MQITLQNDADIISSKLVIHAISDSCYEWCVTEIELWIDGKLRSDDNPLDSFSESTQGAIIAALNGWQLEQRNASRKLMMAVAS